VARIRGRSRYFRYCMFGNSGGVRVALGECLQREMERKIAMYLTPSLLVQLMLVVSLCRVCVLEN